MALGWVNYLSIIIGALNFASLIIITSIVLSRNPKERINWFFASGFFFIAVAYLILPLGAFTFIEGTENIPMLLLTKFYGLALLLGLLMLMISSIAINHGTQFVLKWFILIPSILAVVIISVLLFALDNTSSTIWYSMKAVEGSSNPDIQTSMLFMGAFYPICLTIVVITFIHLIKAFKQTEDHEIKMCLKYFLAGLSVSISMIIPNILSNVLADVWVNAQILNGLEFILVTIGITLMLVGFLFKPISRLRTEEEHVVSVH
ncbi:MAG: hypothetical protein ACTSXA_00880 [Candidatus Heimdallarchaeota archaeon]